MPLKNVRKNWKVKEEEGEAPLKELLRGRSVR